MPVKRSFYNGLLSVRPANRVAMLAGAASGRGEDRYWVGSDGSVAGTDWAAALLTACQRSGSRSRSWAGVAVGSRLSTSCK